MKRIRLDRWATQLQPPRNPRLHIQRCPFSSQEPSAPRRELQQRQCQVQHQLRGQRRHATTKRRASSAAAAVQVEDIGREALQEQADGTSSDPEPKQPAKAPLYAPSHRKALHSAKLSALHARLSLPSKLPLQTLARCLIDYSADPRDGYNNTPLAVLGQDLWGYYTAEYLICRYPRLPMPVLFAAQYAYVGNATLNAIRAEWGVEMVAAPGPEVDPGLLQFKSVEPDNTLKKVDGMKAKDMPQAKRLGTGRRNEKWNMRRGISSRIVLDDQFGDFQTGLPPNDARPFANAPISTSGRSEETPVQNFDASGEAVSGSAPRSPVETEPVTNETASAAFVRALAGAVYLHAGAAASKSFHRDHVLSRHLQLHTLFHFTHPTRDLSRLCAREGFEPPVARLLSESGRLSRTPVFVVGVFSGDNKLGEAAGASLNEARIRAAAAALRAWYLYSPPENEIMLPSELEGVAAKGKGKSVEGKVWKPQMVDIGEIVT